MKTRSKETPPSFKNGGTKTLMMGIVILLLPNTISISYIERLIPQIIFTTMIHGNINVDEMVMVYYLS
jgi:hypothetical protein